ncbi:DUF935 family protein [uncultured Fusobacterium sp.]|uniref:phage portal protein family protein n=1 Tax=uncultured Fusobacterium sp. TaxID=159267 RepID=UPI0025F011D5|nr:DUF935 family protein [uncultured Fusobacterium sp.]
MRKIDKIKKVKRELVVSAVTKLFQESSTSYNNEFDADEVKKIIKDVDINSALQKLERAVAGRKALIVSKTDENIELEKEIQNRFSGIKFNRIVNHLITARYFGYSCFEIVYNEDFTIASLIPIPFDYVNYNTRDKKWVLKVGTKEIDLNREKFLLSIHKWNPAQVTGKSIFDSCFVSFMDKEMYSNQLRGLAKQYGDVITVYPYDINSTEEEKKQLKENVDSLHGKNSIGVPVDELGTVDINKVVTFIKLSDLDPGIYTELEKREKEKLVQNILGSTLTIDNGGGTGSYSLGEVHKEGFDEVVEEICRFVSDSLFQLIEIDAKFHGYNAKEFEFSLEKVFTDTEKIEQEKQQQELNSLKLDNINKLSSAGFEVNIDYISAQLGIENSYLAKKISAGIGPEFSKKKIDELLENARAKQKEFEEMILENSDEIIKEVSKQIKKEFEKVKNLEDIEKISLNLESLKEKLILGALQGYLNEFNSQTIEFSENDLNPFKLSFTEAINWFCKKFPVLYDVIEDITKKVDEQFFYMKRSTELEVTKKLYYNLLDNLKNGGTFKTWLEMSKEVLNKSGLGDSPWYLELVYRNNMASAYNAGAFYNQQLNKKNKPYGLYDGVDDNRQSDICKALDGKVFPLDHPFWNNYLPPNHHGCRSQRIALDAEELEEYGLKVSKSITKEMRELKKEMGSFYGSQVSGMKKAIKQKEKELEEMKNQLKLEV